MSTCTRSWPPLSCGHPGREWSTSIPRLTHHADSLVSPQGALVHPNGGPLSDRMAFGRPFSSNSLSNSARTSAVSQPFSSAARRTYRLNASLAVSGSHRSPLWARHHPLKSTVQRSLGPSTVGVGAPLGRSLSGFRGLRALLRCVRARMRAIVRVLGAGALSRRSSNLLSFFGPHPYC